VAQPKKLWREVPKLSLRDWAPLDEAYARIEQQVGARDLALFDLAEHLRSGELGGAERVLPYSDANLPRLPERTARYRIKAPVCRVFKRQFWSECRLNIWSGGKCVRVWGLPGERERSLEGNHFFFVRRRKLDKLYPVAANERPRSDDLSEPPLRRQELPPGVSRLQQMRREGFFKKPGVEQKRAIAWALDEYPPDGDIPASLTPSEMAEKIQQWRMLRDKPKTRLADDPLRRFCRRFLKDYRQ
jgi:hypothetical protein